jgi:glycerophosphoryl diester phosphodiesterase
MEPWPYPFWIAHRGAGTLAPENTLPAVELGQRHGYRMFECDVRLSADGVPFLMHDDSLERTTTGHGPAANTPWETLATLDAGLWHSPAYAGTGLPTLETVLRYCQAEGLQVNLELKPSPGHANDTGAAVAHCIEQWWPSKGMLPPPLLSSFQPAALYAAQDAAPHLPRGLLLDSLWHGWQDTAMKLECKAVIAHHSLWDRALMAQAKALQLHALSYTVNDAATAWRLAQLGLDGLITDRIDRFDPAARPSPPTP